MGWDGIGWLACRFSSSPPCACSIHACGRYNCHCIVLAIRGRTVLPNLAPSLTSTSLSVRHTSRWWSLKWWSDGHTCLRLEYILYYSRIESWPMLDTYIACFIRGQPQELLICSMEFMVHTFTDVRHHLTWLETLCDICFLEVLLRKAIVHGQIIHTSILGECIV